jgi:hypothetical protein
MKKKDILRGAVDGELMVIIAMVLGLVVLIAVVGMAALEDGKRWKQFKVDHACKVVAKKEGQYVSGGNGGGYISAQTGWLCDDGVTYFKED